MSKFFFNKLSQEIEKNLRSGELKHVRLSYVSAYDTYISMSNYSYENIDEEDFEIMKDFFKERNMKFERHESCNSYDARYDDDENMISPGGYSFTYWFNASFKKDSDVLAPNEMGEFFN